MVPGPVLSGRHDPEVLRRVVCRVIILVVYVLAVTLPDLTRPHQFATGGIPLGTTLLLHGLAAVLPLCRLSAFRVREGGFLTQ